MLFKATEDQLKSVAINAFNASCPSGMGFLHFNPNDELSPQEIRIETWGVEIDYCGGRMVKLLVFRQSDDTWKISEPHPEYQSWVAAYPTAKDLVLSVTGTIILSEGE